MGLGKWIADFLERGADRFQRWFGHDTELLHYTTLREHPEPWPDVSETHKEVEISSFGEGRRAVQ